MIIEKKLLSFVQSINIDLIDKRTTMILLQYIQFRLFSMQTFYIDKLLYDQDNTRRRRRKNPNKLIRLF